MPYFFSIRIHSNKIEFFCLINISNYMFINFFLYLNVHTILFHLWRKYIYEDFIGVKKNISINNVFRPHDYFCYLEKSLKLFILDIFYHTLIYISKIFVWSYWYSFFLFSLNEIKYRKNHKKELKTDCMKTSILKDTL